MNTTENIQDNTYRNRQVPTANTTEKLETLTELKLDKKLPIRKGPYPPSAGPGIYYIVLYFSGNNRFIDIIIYRNIKSPLNIFGFTFYKESTKIKL